MAVTQHHTCLQEGTETIFHTLVGVGQTPNVAAVLMVGMGCESMSASRVGGAVAESGKPVESVVCQECGGTRKTIARGKQILSKLVRHARGQKRKAFDDGRLVVGMKCGGSDTTLGVAANPAIGVAADRIVDTEGKSIEAVVAELLAVVRRERPG